MQNVLYTREKSLPKDKTNSSNATPTLKGGHWRNLILGEQIHLAYKGIFSFRIFHPLGRGTENAKRKCGTKNLPPQLSVLILL